MSEFGKRHIKLAIEKYDRFTVRTFENILHQVGGDYVDSYLDSVNSMGASEGIEAIGEVLCPCTVNRHVKDFTAQRVYHMMGFVPASPTKSEWQEVLDWLVLSRCSI